MATSADARDLVRPALNRDRILDAAEAMLDDGRPLTMRALGERLGVTAMALYKWFAGKDELLDALTDRLSERDTSAPAPDGPWLDRGMHFANATRRSLLAHLPLLQLDGAPRRLATTMYRRADEALALMLELGYEPQAAVDAYRVLFWSILDHCLVIDATDAMPGVVAPGQIAEGVARTMGPDLVGRMPTLAALLPHFTAVDPDVFFEHTMRVVLRGLLAEAPGASGEQTPG